MKKLVSFLLILFSVYSCRAQQSKLPFWDEILAFKKEDSATPPPARPILFVGSSSIRLWKNLKEDFPGYPILNRGFGGSSLPDVIRYADMIIFPYNPRQIVIYCGENDLAGSDTTVTGATVATRFEQLFTLIRSRLPNVPIVFVSLKPSPSREKLLPKMVEANRAIQAFLKKHPKTTYVDVYRPMLDARGNPVTSLFGNDMLHMNAQGYAIWKKALRPALIK